MPDELPRTRLRPKGQITLPPAVQKALHVGVGDELAFEQTDRGVLVRGLHAIPSDQAWFWTERWQAMEHKVDAHVARGEVTTHASTDDFLAHLDALNDLPKRTEREVSDDPSV